MTIGTILLGVALLILVGLYLARPFLKPHKVSDHPATKREQLLIEKESILTQIQKLDFDVDTKKIPPEVHQVQREELVQRAAVILQQLDEMDTHPSTIDAEIEAAIASIRQVDTVVSAPVVQPAANNGKGRFCPECGNSTGASDNFCTNCGHKLVAKPQAATS